MWSAIYIIKHEKNLKRKKEKEKKRNQSYPWYTNMHELDSPTLEIFQMHTNLIQWML